MKQCKKLSTKDLVKIAILGTVATVIYYFDFPVPLMPNFIKLDLSNTVSLFAGFALGPFAGVLVCLIKDALHFLVKGMGTTLGIGDIFDFVTSCTLVLTSSLIYRRSKTKKSAFVGCLVGTAAFTAISLPLNYFFTYPLYAAAFGGMENIIAAYEKIMPNVGGIFGALCIFNVPFTLVKGLLCTAVVMLVYKPLITALRKSGLVSVENTSSGNVSLK